MPFVPYARTPGRLAGQVVGDVALLVWCYVAVRLAGAVRDSVLSLAEPGRQLDAGATGIAGDLREAGDRASGVPLVGDELSTPFASAGDAADAIARAGQRQVEVVGDLATVLHLVVLLVPILLAVALWVPGRVRFGLRAGAARRFVDADADLRLFALRAMTNQPMHKVARISDDPVAAFQAGDVEVVRALAALELADSGLRPPPRVAA